MKIAVISDLHCGLGARTDDLCPEGFRVKSSGDPNSTSNGFCRKFIDFIKKEKLAADYLLVPGDLTDSAHPMEVQVASNFLQEAQKALHVSNGKLLFVPGNHDVDWDLLDSKDKTGVKWAHRYMALEADKFVFSQINNKGITDGNLFADSCFNLWEFDNLIVLGYNSSATDTALDKGRKGNIEQAHIDYINQILTQKKYKTDKRLKVFMIHHHLRDFKLPCLQDRDFSQANNPESMITMLQDHNFNLIVHGHRHYSFFDAQNSQIPILCAGSFSARINVGWEGFVLNQFHILDVDCPESARIGSSGVVNSWSYTINGWRKSPCGEGYGGVPYQRVFGFSLKDQKLAEEVKSCLIELSGDRSNISWQKDVLSKVRGARYLNEDTNQLIQWCRSEVFQGEDWDVFPRGEGDVFFAKKV